MLLSVCKRYAIAIRLRKFIRNEYIYLFLSYVNNEGYFNGEVDSFRMKCARFLRMATPELQDDIVAERFDQNRSTCLFSVGINAAYKFAAKRDLKSVKYGLKGALERRRDGRISQRPSRRRG